MSECILQMKNITKTFPGVIALDKVNLDVTKGEIHALVGENGAGKSTLMNVLSGIYPYGTYEGEILYKGEVCNFKSIRDSEKMGIAIIHQELALSPFMSIAENIFLGNERQTNGVIDWDETNNKAKEVMASVGLNESHNALIRDIGVGKQQLVEIAKALAKDCELLILDEPTAALNDEDSDHLLTLLKKLNKEQGISCIIISHKLNEIAKVSDRITIIRDGQVIETLDNHEKGAISEDRIIKGMVGRDMVDRFPKRTPHIGEIGFEVEHWNVYDPLNEERKVIDDVSFNLRKGEVVGLAGLMGAGRTELAMSIFGKAYGKKISGKIIKDGKELHLHNVSQAIENGIAYLTEDRKNAGLVLIQDISSNTAMSNLKNLSSNGIVDDEKVIKSAEEYRAKLQTKCSSVFQSAGNLSGGNQQKVVLSKWLSTLPDVLLLDEPTRGIDVGAKYEIYNIINDIANEGKCVLVISSELPEILGVADRIYIMNEGKLIGETTRDEATPEKIMARIIQSANE
ncbi:MAG: multiple monosaccharide ABC transporter ATP-binding protein [Eubacteriales bacterium]